MANEIPTPVADIAVLGMAVMGKNLALNMADRGFRVAVYNRTTAKAIQAAQDHPEQQLIPAESLAHLVKILKKPRKLFLMVKAGGPTDALINELLPRWEEGDIIMDGGNAHFQDTRRRYEAVQARGLRYLGVGVSGGESGARFGPAIMPGGDLDTYTEVSPILTAIAAKAPDGSPCCAYMGENGAGHYVKMVHNAIEYADMQLIADLYFFLKTKGLPNEQIADLFEEWNTGDLSSYLSEITVRILREKDPQDPSVDLDPSLSEEDPPTMAIRAYGADSESASLVDHILDISRNKGTGKWTNEEALNLGIDLSVLGSGLNTRYISTEKELRVIASQTLPSGVLADALGELETAALAKAFLAARLLAYAQGFALYKAAAKAYGWNLDYRTIAATFRAGCIIRSTLLSPIMAAYEADPELDNLLLSPNFTKTLQEGIPALRGLVGETVATGVPLPTFQAAISYYDQLRTARSSANLIQAQRDYFGAHTFQRTDTVGIFHHEWPQTDEEA